MHIVHPRISHDVMKRFHVLRIDVLMPISSWPLCLWNGGNWGGHRGQRYMCLFCIHTYPVHKNYVQSLAMWSLGISRNLPHSATRQNLGLYMFKLDPQKSTTAENIIMFSFHSCTVMRTKWPVQPLLPHRGLCWQIDECLVYYADEWHGGIRAGPMVYRASWPQTWFLLKWSSEES